jgi:hypothetical protein
MELYIGDSRDIVVTQKQMVLERTNEQRSTNRSTLILYDTNEEVEAALENFKDSPAVLTMVQHIDGEWEMDRCLLDGKQLTMGTDYKKKDANTLEFEITLPARTETGPSKKVLRMVYHHKNVRGNVPLERFARK